MKKLIASFALLASVAAQAEYMYWSVAEDQIDVDILDDVTYMRVGYVKQAGDEPAWKGAALATYDTAGDVMTFGDNQTAYDVDYVSGDQYTVDLSGLSVATYSFYVELLNAEHSVIGRSETFTTYESLKSNNYVATGDIGSAQQAAVWHGGSISAVPEPSSMALLALGAGLVGLRRKLKKGKKGKRA